MQLIQGPNSSLNTLMHTAEYNESWPQNEKRDLDINKWHIIFTCLMAKHMMNLYIIEFQSFFGMTGMINILQNTVLKHWHLC